MEKQQIMSKSFSGIKEFCLKNTAIVAFLNVIACFVVFSMNFSSTSLSAGAASFLRISGSLEPIYFLLLVINSILLTCFNKYTVDKRYVDAIKMNSLNILILMSTIGCLSLLWANADHNSFLYFPIIMACMFIIAIPIIFYFEQNLKARTKHSSRTAQIFFGIFYLIVLSFGIYSVTNHYPRRFNTQKSTEIQALTDTDIVNNANDTKVFQNEEQKYQIENEYINWKTIIRFLLFLIILVLGYCFVIKLGDGNLEKNIFKRITFYFSIGFLIVVNSLIIYKTTNISKRSIDESREFYKVILGEIAKYTDAELQSTQDVRNIMERLTKQGMNFEKQFDNVYDEFKETRKESDKKLGSASEDIKDHVNDIYDKFLQSFAQIHDSLATMKKNETNLHDQYRWLTIKLDEKEAENIKLENELKDYRENKSKEAKEEINKFIQFQIEINRKDDKITNLNNELLIKNKKIEEFSEIEGQLSFCEEEKRNLQFKLQQSNKLTELLKDTLNIKISEIKKRDSLIINQSKIIVRSLNSIDSLLLKGFNQCDTLGLENHRAIQQLHALVKEIDNHRLNILFEKIGMLFKNDTLLFNSLAIIEEGQSKLCKNGSNDFDDFLTKIENAERLLDALNDVLNSDNLFRFGGIFTTRMSEVIDNKTNTHLLEESYKSVIEQILISLDNLKNKKPILIWDDFGTGKALVPRENDFKKAISKLKLNKGDKIVVIGFADRQMGDNLILSINRAVKSADIIKSILINNNIAVYPIGGNVYDNENPIQDKRDRVIMIYKINDQKK